MTLILLQAIIQSIASTLYWIGLYVGIGALPGDESRRLGWAIGSSPSCYWPQTASSAPMPPAFRLRC
jgi:hypothetical protein